MFNNRKANIIELQMKAGYIDAAQYSISRAGDSAEYR